MLAERIVLTILILVALALVPRLAKASYRDTHLMIFPAIFGALGGALIVALGIVWVGL